VAGAGHVSVDALAGTALLTSIAETVGTVAAEAIEADILAETKKIVATNGGVGLVLRETVKGVNIRGGGVVLVKVALLDGVVLGEVLLRLEVRLGAVNLGLGDGVAGDGDGADGALVVGNGPLGGVVPKGDEGLEAVEIAIETGERRIVSVGPGGAFVLGGLGK
jgi:hypothetical protein